MRTKLIENINFERNIDPKDSMNIGLPGIRAMVRMKPGIIYRTEEKRWYYYHFFKNPENNEVYYSFPSGRKVIHAYRFLSKHKPSDFPLNLIPTSKHFDKYLPKITFVNESINFERGGDPKDTIQIGRKHIWNMSSREMAEHIMDDISNKVRPILNRIDAAIKEAGFESQRTYQDYIYDYFDNHDEFPKVSQEIDDAEQELEETIKNECLKYPVKPGANPNNKVPYMEGLVSDLFTLMLEGGPHGTYVQMIMSKLDPSYLKESMDFKRKQLPLKSLGIGQKEQKKKLIKILPDLSNNLLWDETYKKIINGIKREDTMVSISDEYITIKTPVLTWRFADNLRIILNMSSEKVELEKKPSRERIYLRGPAWMVHDYKVPRVYKYRIL